MIEPNIEEMRREFDEKISLLERMMSNNFPCACVKNQEAGKIIESYPGTRNCPFVWAATDLAKTCYTFGIAKNSKSEPENLERFECLSTDQRSRANSLLERYFTSLKTVNCSECVEHAYLERLATEYMRRAAWPDYERKEVKRPVLEDPFLEEILKVQTPTC
jgi:hypothetical protein